MAAKGKCRNAWKGKMAVQANAASSAGETRRGEVAIAKIDAASSAKYAMPSVFVTSTGCHSMMSGRGTVAVCQRNASNRGP